MAKKPKKEEDIKSETKEEASETQNAPMLSVLAQYTKDQSFENPNAPDSLRSGLSAPEIQINFAYIIAHLHAVVYLR